MPCCGADARLNVCVSDSSFSGPSQTPVLSLSSPSSVSVSNSNFNVTGVAVQVSSSPAATAAGSQVVVQNCTFLSSTIAASSYPDSSNGTVSGGGLVSLVLLNNRFNNDNAGAVTSVSVTGQVAALVSGNSFGKASVRSVNQRYDTWTKGTDAVAVQFECRFSRAMLQLVASSSIRPPWCSSLARPTRSPTARVASHRAVRVSCLAIQATTTFARRKALPRMLWYVESNLEIR